MNGYTGKRGWNPADVAGQAEFGPDIEECLQTACETNNLFHSKAKQSVPAVRLVIHTERHKPMEFLLANTQIYFYLAI